MPALLACLALSAGYVAPFYALPLRGDRNSPAVVRARMACSLAYCAAASPPVWLLLGRPDAAAFAQQLGLRGAGLPQAVALPLLLTALLFAGPWSLWLAGRPWRVARLQLAPLQPRQLRDLVVAPLTEEWVFRALLLAVLQAEGVSRAAAGAVAPLFFGAAHLHHLHHLMRREGCPASRAVPMVAFQFCYTTAFGWYAAWLFMRSGHLAAAVLPHCLCNWLGVPDLTRVRGCGAPRLVAAAFLAGVAGFALLLGPLTRPALYMHA